MKLLDILNGAWAIQPEKLAEIQEIYCTHLRGDKIDISAIEALHGPLQNREQGYEVVNGVAIVPVIGVIAKRMNLFSQISGGVSTELVARDFKAALVDPDVNSILIEIDSPGGNVDGTSELAQMIYESRGEKPIVAWANGLIASAGYWIGSAADQIYNSGDTTIVGSIGVLTRHIDFSKMDAKEGVKRTYIYAGKYKIVGADNKPLTKDDKSIIQANIDYIYSIFVEAVAKHRGADVETVLNDMAEGRIFHGQQAIDAGLVDGVATFDQLIEVMSGGDMPDIADFSAGALSNGDAKKVIAAIEAELDKSTAIKIPKQEAIMAKEIVKDFIITKDLVLEQAPGVAEAFREEGKASVNLESIKTEGAKAERERIQAVLGQSMPGHEETINAMAFDGKTTGPEAAMKILQAVKGKKEKIASALEEDAKALGVVRPSASNAVEETSTEIKLDENATTEERAQAEWDKDKKLQADFGGKFGAYLAYVNAEGEAKLKMQGSK